MDGWMEGVRICGGRMERARFCGGRMNGEAGIVGGREVGGDGEGGDERGRRWKADGGRGRKLGVGREMGRGRGRYGRGGYAEGMRLGFLVWDSEGAERGWFGRRVVSEDSGRFRGRGLAVRAMLRTAPRLLTLLGRKGGFGRNKFLQFSDIYSDCKIIVPSQQSGWNGHKRKTPVVSIHGTYKYRRSCMPGADFLYLFGNVLSCR